MKSLDRPVDRRGTNSVKWDGHGQMGIPAKALPLWVADMDFEVMPEVLTAIQRRAAHGIYGYSLASDSYFDSLQDWMLRRYQWQTKREWVLTIPGVVPAINLALQAFTQPGEAVLIQPPVYPPFANAVLASGRKLVTSPLFLNGDRYEIDFTDFEAQAAANRVKLFILCSPHNPVGRVWELEELRRIAAICIKYDTLIVADEIHQDLTFPGVQHYSLATVDDAIVDSAIICTAPSKTFNLAGLQTANIFVPNPALREQYAKTARCWGMSRVNTIGLAACEAAYKHGAGWLSDVMAYVAANAEYVRDYLISNLAQIKMAFPEGLYLLWLDCTRLGLYANELERFLLDEAGLWLNQGYTFGVEGNGFVRLNIACCRSLLVKAMSQLSAAVAKLNR